MQRGGVGQDIRKFVCTCYVNDLIINWIFCFRSESADHELSSKELYQLLAYATKSMREECIKKQKQANIEITKRFVDALIYSSNLLNCVNYLLVGLTHDL